MSVKNEMNVRIDATALMFEFVICQGYGIGFPRYTAKKAPSMPRFICTSFLPTNSKMSHNALLKTSILLI
jgi:hypothetical protein